MKTQKLFSMIAILFIAVLLVLVSIVSAPHTVSPNSLKFTDPVKQLTFTLTPPDAIGHSYTATTPTITQEDGSQITFTLSDLSGITSAKLINVTANNVKYGSLIPGKNYLGTIVIKDSATLSDTVNVSVNFVGSFCKIGEKGKDLKITKVDIDNADGDEEEWTPLDEIKVEVEVSNEGNEKIKNVFVELGLLDSQGNNVIDDMEDLDDEEIDIGSIKDGKEDKAVFTFTVPADFEEDTYSLVVKAFSKDLNEENLCVSHSSDLDNTFFHKIDGEREEDEDKHIILDKMLVSPSPAQCGERVQVTGEVVNVGDNDYEDQIKVVLFNKELGINLEKVIKENFDQGDSEVVDFEFDVKDRSEEKFYVLEFTTFYDYDDGNNGYDLNSEETFTTSLRVAGNCRSEATKNVEITAVLDEETPEAVAGKQLIVKSSIKNTGGVETTYTIAVLGNSEWSTLASIEPQIFSLKPGDSKEVNIVLSVNNEAQGEREFTIKTSYDGQEKEQKVALTVSSAPTNNPQLIPLIENIKSNWFIYLIIIVNIILIIAIILVIRSMVSPRPL